LQGEGLNDFGHDFGDDLSDGIEVDLGDDFEVDLGDGIEVDLGDDFEVDLEDVSKRFRESVRDMISIKSVNNGIKFT